MREPPCSSSLAGVAILFLTTSLNTARSAERGLARESTIIWHEPILKPGVVTVTCHGVGISTDRSFSDFRCFIPGLLLHRERCPMWYLGAHVHLTIGDLLTRRSQHSEYRRATEYCGYLPTGSSTRADNRRLSGPSWSGRVFSETTQQLLLIAWVKAVHALQH